MQCLPNTAKTIVRATIVLHNMLRKKALAGEKDHYTLHGARIRDDAALGRGSFYKNFSAVAMDDRNTSR
jgi:hypothetical protein